MSDPQKDYNVLFLCTGNSARSQLAAHGGTIAQVPAERGAAFEITLPVAGDVTAGPNERTLSREERAG